MKLRWVGVAVAIALVGALLGYGLGVQRRTTPRSFAAAPVPAASPSYPVMPVAVLPDNPAPALQAGIATQQVKLGVKPFQVTAPVPTGWVEYHSNASEWKWYPSWALSDNVYFVRVRMVGNDYQSIESALRTRLARLEEATAVADLDIEERGSDRFVASYVSDEHRRVAYEGFLSRNGSDTADIYIAVVGREPDRAGLADLFGRLMAETSPAP